MALNDVWQKFRKELKDNPESIDLNRIGRAFPTTAEEGAVWAAAVNIVYKESGSDFAIFQNDIADQFARQAAVEGYDAEVQQMISNGWKKAELKDMQKAQLIYAVISSTNYAENIKTEVNDVFHEVLVQLGGGTTTNLNPVDTARAKLAETDKFANDKVKENLEKEQSKVGAAEPVAGNIDKSEEDYSKSDFVNALQCALLSDLVNLAKFRRGQCFVRPAGEGSTDAINNLVQQYAYRNRIANFMTSKPENLINRLTLKNTVSWKGQLPSGFFDQIGSFFEVFKVNKSGEEFYVPNKLGVGDTNELRIGYSAKETPNGVEFPTSMGDVNIEEDVKRSNIKDTVFFLKDADISYEGGTPATARRDVEVNLTYSFKGLQILDTPFYILETERDDTTKIMEVKADAKISHRHKPVDLILFPMGIDGTSGAGRLFKKQYDPSYTRLRIKYGTFWDPDNMTEEQKIPIMNAIYAGPLGGWGLTDADLKKVAFSEYHLDLSVVDHTLSLKEDGNADEWELKITYRGYTQSLITSPLFDSMQDHEDLVGKIQAENELIAAATEKDCSAKALRRLYRTFNAKIEEQAVQSHQKIINRLISKERVQWLAVPNKNLSKLISASPMERANVLSSKSAGGIGMDITGGVEKQVETYKTGDPEKFDEALEKEMERALNDGSGTKVPYFYIGDLIEVATDAIFQPRRPMRGAGSDKTVEQVPINIKIVCGCFKYFDPQTDQDVIINISEIPISVAFFQSWFHDTVIKNKKTYYPVGSFIRDLCEVAASNLLAEVCFGPTMEPKLLFGSTYMQGKRLKWDSKENEESSYYMFKGESFDYGTTGGYSDAMIARQEKYGVAVTKPWRVVDSLKRRQPTIVGTNRVIDYLPPDDPNLYGYFVIYPHSNNAFSMDNNGSKASMIRNYVPYLPFGVSNLNGPVNKINFSKVDTPGQREARYHNSSQNGLTMLANVYDVSIDTDAVFDYFPGSLVYIDPVDLSEGTGIGTETHPYESNSLSHHMGLGGYHVITKSSIKFTGLASATTKATCAINAKWVYSGSDSETRRIGGSRSITKPLESEACAQHLLSETATRVDEIAEAAVSAAAAEAEERAAEIKELEEKREKIDEITGNSVNTYNIFGVDVIL